MTRDEALKIAIETYLRVEGQLHVKAEQDGETFCVECANRASVDYRIQDEDCDWPCLPSQVVAALREEPRDVS